MILMYQILTHGWNTITRSEEAWNFTSLQSSRLPSLHKTCHHFTSIITTTFPPQNPPSFHFNHHNYLYLPSTKHPIISLQLSQIPLPSLHKTPHHFTSVITNTFPTHNRPPFHLNHHYQYSITFPHKTCHSHPRPTRDVCIENQDAQDSWAVMPSQPRRSYQGESMNNIIFPVHHTRRHSPPAATINLVGTRYVTWCFTLSTGAVLSRGGGTARTSHSKSITAGSVHCPSFGLCAVEIRRGSVIAWNSLNFLPPPPQKPPHPSL